MPRQIEAHGNEDETNEAGVWVIHSLILAFDAAASFPHTLTNSNLSRMPKGGKKGGDKGGETKQAEKKEAPPAADNKKGGKKGGK
ncbi:hypothetical protein Poli38472_001338 [Pythium oligandrum]|uniref:Uncharacterized protein n=1 Tax=Pythium oligandrum TaxID=41045 RepID=A0A8K1FRN4_PYTOL|nr:hypothetical protein Poli38472_001338 [Pythium oligandrum]|eukprot:TMW69182.1 hypothetical protein Poli38472_001338 [Pythium oligandrum]